MLEENTKETVANDEVSAESQKETTDKAENKKDASKIKSHIRHTHLRQVFSRGVPRWMVARCINSTTEAQA